MLGATLATVGRGELSAERSNHQYKGCRSQDTTVCNCHYTNCSDKNDQRMLTALGEVGKRIFTWSQI